MINLRITEEQFNQLYPDLAGYYGFFDNPPPTDITPEDFERRYLSNKLWRLNNIYTVIDKHGNEVIFRMNYAQHLCYSISRIHPRIIILKSRQQGISTLWLISYFDDGLVEPHFDIGLMAQGKHEASTLLQRSKLLWEKLDDDVKDFFDAGLVRSNSSEIKWRNESTTYIRVSFRSTTLQRLHISEMGKIANQYPQRATETKTGSLQALARGNTGVIESTAEGHNMFKDMWDQAVIAHNSGQMTTKDFWPVFLSWLNDPDCVESVPQEDTEESIKYFKELEEQGIVATREQKNFWIMQYRELGGDTFQEYPATPEEAFTASRDGTYYSRLFMAHIVRRKRLENKHDPRLITKAVFDLGVDDYTVVGTCQWYEGSLRIISELWNNGQAIDYYLDQLRDLPYEIHEVVLPHDANQRSMVTKGHIPKSIRDRVVEYIEENNLTWIVTVLDRAPILDGIDQVRKTILDMWISPDCEYIQTCLLRYTKEWDPKLKTWKKEPKHDEYSHGADMLRGMVAAIQPFDDFNEVHSVSQADSTGYDV